jgi:hypothetical protein
MMKIDQNAAAAVIMNITMKTHAAAAVENTNMKAWL